MRLPHEQAARDHRDRNHDEGDDLHLFAMRPRPAGGVLDPGAELVFLDLVPGLALHGMRPRSGS
jgi:hypothetical protein